MGCWGVPWKDGMGDRASSEVQNQHPIGLELIIQKTLL